MMYTRTRLSRIVLLFAVCATLTHALFAVSPLSERMSSSGSVSRCGRYRRADAR
jgi:hypothetical protein